MTRLTPFGYSIKYIKNTLYYLYEKKVQRRNDYRPLDSPNDNES